MNLDDDNNNENISDSEDNEEKIGENKTEDNSFYI